MKLSSNLKNYYLLSTIVLILVIVKKDISLIRAYIAGLIVATIQISISYASAYLAIGSQKLTNSPQSLKWSFWLITFKVIIFAILYLGLVFFGKWGFLTMVITALLLKPSLYITYTINRKGGVK